MSATLPKPAVKEHFDNTTKKTFLCKSFVRTVTISVPERMPNEGVYEMMRNAYPSERFDIFRESGEKVTIRNSLQH